jgi:putative Holliday junction resolvase
MKILALDLGDRWVGSALSDGLGITCKPYQTVELVDLPTFLLDVIKREGVRTIIVGYPKTLSGGQSLQTEKVAKFAKQLEQKIGAKQEHAITWILWDERLSSKRAQEVRHAVTPEEKRKSHSIAAAFILQGYLDGMAFRDANADTE